jgi:hypothetical protein
MSANPKLTIEEHGRCGLVRYREDDREILFEWEFCGGDRAVAAVWPRPFRRLTEQNTWPGARIADILDLVGREIVARKAPGCRYEIDADVSRITIVGA